MGKVKWFHGMKVIGGLPVPEGTNCAVGIDYTNGLLIMNVSNTQYMLGFVKISGIELSTDIDKQVYSKSSTMGGFVGGALFGLAGVVIGSAPKTAVSSQILQGIILSYDDVQTGGTAYIVLSDIVRNSWACQKLATAINPLIANRPPKVVNMGGAGQENIEYVPVDVPKPKSSAGIYVLILVLGIIAVLAVFVIVGSNAVQQDKQKEVAAQAALLVDVTQFSMIPTDELVLKMGEPEAAEDWDNNGIPTTTYIYNNGNYEFLIVDGKVAEMNIYAGQDSDMPYSSVEGMCNMFGIPSHENIIMYKNTGAAMRFNNVGYGIEDIWIPIYDSETKQIGAIKFAYSMAAIGK